MCRYSAAHGSASVAFAFATALLMTKGIGTARSGSVSFDGRSSVMRKVRSSTASNCSGRSRPPAFICTVGKPPIDTARSNDHFTSSAVTGVPSQNVASRSVKVSVRPSSEVSHVSASSGSSDVES